MAAAAASRSVDCSEERVCVSRRIFRARVTPCPHDEGVRYISGHAAICRSTQCCLVLLDRYSTF